jgi:iron complex outermembrane receptor protein
VKGIEWDATAHFGHLTLRGAGAYSEGIYTDYPAGGCPIELTGAATAACNLTGKGMPGLPKWSISAGGEYVVPISAGDLFVRADLSGKTNVFGDATDSAYTVIKGYTLVNASIGFRASKTWEVAVFARNLFNKDYLQNVTVQAGNSGLIVGTPSDPRMFGITLRGKM